MLYRANFILRWTVTLRYSKCCAVGFNESFSFAAHCRGRATSFVLKQKKQKIKSVRRLLALGAFALQNGQNRGRNLFTLPLRRFFPRFCKNFLCPAAAPAGIVLPVFG